MCDERERLIEYVYDECSAPDRREMEAHLHECRVCREEIGGLRRVRQDLLAWDVPQHESVWQPFTPAPVTWSWRDVPTWALAAAATVMFAVGAAGGVVTHALVPHAEPGVVVAAAPAQPALTPVALTEMESRLLGLVRQEMSGLRPVSTAQTTTDLSVLETRLLARLRAELGAVDARQVELDEIIRTMANDLARNQNAVNDMKNRMQTFELEVADRGVPGGLK